MLHERPRLALRLLATTRERPFLPPSMPPITPPAALSTLATSLQLRPLTNSSTLSTLALSSPSASSLKSHVYSSRSLMALLPARSTRTQPSKSSLCMARSSRLVGVNRPQFQARLPSLSVRAMQAVTSTLEDLTRVRPRSNSAMTSAALVSLTRSRLSVTRTLALFTSSAFLLLPRQKISSCDSRRSPLIRFFS